VLSARCDPPVHIARLRAEGQLAEIRAEHLRFRPAEAAELLRDAGLDVATEQVAVMLARTEGWAAALRLIAVGLRDRRGADGVRRFLDELHVTDRSLTDYLASEVLDRLTADVCDVLRRVSICDRLSPSLAGALTGRADASDVLRWVERATSLVTWFGGRDKEYRIHPLLRAYLEADLDREHPHTARALRVVAAGWYEARGALATAAAYASRSGDPPCMKEFLSRNGTVLLGAGKHDEVQAALRALGEPHVASEPRLSLISALANLTVGRLTAAAVDRGRASLTPADGLTMRLRVLVDAQRALLTGGPLPAELQVSPADGGTQTADGGEADGVEEVWLTAARGSAAARTRDTRSARRDLDRADAAARACGYPAVRVQVLVGLAGLDAAEGDHRGMAARAAAAVELASDHGLGESPWLGAAQRMLAGPAAQLRLEHTCPELGATDRAAAALTDRESIVLRRLCSQRSLDEIAGDLTVSPNTVKTHVRAIYGKLGARSRRQAVAIAQRRGMV
jgi:LuxR family maltose regulon positive regulatory protein